MLLATGSLPRRAELFGFEVKWDGVRAVVAVDRGTVRINTRNGRDASSTYPELAGLAGAVGNRAVLLDGELVAFDPMGRPSFELHQQRMHVRTPSPALVKQVPIVLCVFDLLMIDGRNLVGEPLSSRRTALQGLSLRGPSWQTPPWSIGDPGPIRTVVDGLGLEGIVAKRLDSIYKPGRRSSAWIKIKSPQHGHFVVGGWTEGSNSRTGRLGALVVGERHGESLDCAGRVGSGLTEAEIDRLETKLGGLSSDVNPFSGPVPDRPHFVTPKIVINVRYTERTRDGHLRHPVYLGEVPSEA